VSGFLRSVGSASGVKEGTQKLGRFFSLLWELTVPKKISIICIKIYTHIAIALNH